MKKVFLLIAVLSLLSSCSKKQSQEIKKPETAELQSALEKAKNLELKKTRKNKKKQEQQQEKPKIQEVEITHLFDLNRNDLLLVPKSGKQIIPNDFSIGVLQNQNNLDGDKLIVFKSIDEFLIGLKQKKIIENSIHPSWKKLFVSKLNSYLLKDFYPEKYRIGELFFDQEKTECWFNVRIYKNNADVSGEIEYNKIGGDWKMSVFNLDLSELRHAYTGNADFDPALYIFESERLKALSN